MGRSKALLPFGSGTGETFVSHIIAGMRDAGLDDILVVGRPEDDELQRALLQSGLPARFAVNPNHDRGQLTSIVAAVNAVDRPGVRGVLIVPVDMPLIQPETFAAVLRTSAAHPHAIVRAAYGGRHGHPVVFDRGTFTALRRADPAIGAKQVLRAHLDRVIDVDVPDNGVVRDVDTLDDYVALFGCAPDA